MGNQFYDFDNVDWACKSTKNKNISLISMSIAFFLLIPTTEFIVIKIETCNPSLLYYFTFNIELIWFLAWLLSIMTGKALKSAGILCKPFCKAYWSKFVTAELLPKLIVGSYVWFWSMMALTFDVREDMSW